MKIYIVRHAIAEEVAARGGGDAARALTSEGRDKMKMVAKGFAKLNPDIEKIFSSPLVRAKQTAEILAKVLKKNVEEMIELAPGHYPEEVSEKLRRIKKIKSAMVVGHEPNCSELASYLLGFKDTAIEFKKGAICLVESSDLNPGSGLLIWHLSPQVLRLMGK